MSRNRYEPGYFTVTGENYVFIGAPLSVLLWVALFLTSLAGFSEWVSVGVGWQLGILVVIPLLTLLERLD